MEDKNLRLIELSTRLNEMNQMERNEDPWSIEFRDGKIIIHSEYKGIDILSLDITDEYHEYKYELNYKSSLGEYNCGTIRMGWILTFLDTKGEEMGIDEYFNHLPEYDRNKRNYCKYLRNSNKLNWGNINDNKRFYKRSWKL